MPGNGFLGDAINAMAARRHGSRCTSPHQQKIAIRLQNGIQLQSSIAGVARTTWTDPCFLIPLGTTHEPKR
jgi:hypothetical protein